MDYSTLFSHENGLAHLPAFITSLAVGLLIGLERERNPAAKAGLRTFALTALLGTLMAMLADTLQAPWMLIAAMLIVGAMIIAAYREGEVDEDPGTTTQAALVLCFGLGAMIWYGYSTLAVMLAIAATMLLYFKPELQSISKSLSRQDLRSILQFAVLSFIVLPILPDQELGPYDALNPYRIWLIVVLIAGVGLAGYVALRLVGQRYGAPLLGFFGGLVSSTATTLVYARHGERSESLRRLAVVVILIANLVVLLRLGVISGAVSPRILPQFLPVLLGGLVLGGGVTFLMWRQMSRGGDLPVPEISNPTEIRIALGFGLMYAVVLFCATWLAEYVGDRGLYGLALVSGLTDVDPISLSSLRLYELGKLTPAQTVTTMVIAYNSNLLFKLGLVLVVGGRGMARQCLPGMLAVGIGMTAMLGFTFWR